MRFDYNKLQLIMTKKGINNIDVVKVSGISANTISSVVNGRQMPTKKTIGKIAKALEVDVTELIAE